MLSYWGQRNFEALHGLCKRLKWFNDVARPACKLAAVWQIVLEYVAFGSARFFNVCVETTEPIGEAEPGWRYALVDRHYRQPA